MPRTALLTLALLVVSLVAGGCTTMGQTDDLDTTIEDIHRQLFKLQKDSARQTETLETVREAVEGGDGGSREEWADLQVKVDQLGAEMRVVVERLGETQAQISELIEQVRLARRDRALAGGGAEPPAASAPPEGAAGPAPSEGGSPTTAAGPDDLFNRAYADFSRRDYPLAAWQFGEFLERYPDSSLADDAQYWVGECHFAEGDYQAAVGAFERLVERYPAGDKVPAGHLKAGMSYLQLRQTKDAVLQLQHVVDVYPGTDEARIARDQLRQRGLSGN